MSQREPILNVSEPSPLRFALLLAALFALIRYTPLGRNLTANDLLVLRPVEYTEGLGWLSAGGHAFAHGSWGHVAMNGVFLVIFAIPAMRMARAHGRNAELTWMALFFAGVFAGAFAQWFAWAAEDVLGLIGNTVPSAVGASGGVSALFAAAGYAMGGRALMLRFGFAWLLINIFFVFFSGPGGVGVAWAAHLGGFAGGMVAAPPILEGRKV